MPSRIWLINFVLMVGVIFFGIRAYEVWPGGRWRSTEFSDIKKPLPWVEKRVERRNTSPESDYEVIVSYNLFAGDRLERPARQEKSKASKPQAKVSKKVLNLLEWALKRTNLYGVIMVGNHKEALIGEVPDHMGKSVGEIGVKRARAGDIVGRFKVKEINDTNVLLSAEGHEWRISMFDKDKPKKRVPRKKDGGPTVIVGGSTTGSIQKEAKAVEKGRMPKPEVSKKETLPKAQNKRRTIPLPAKKTNTNKR